MSRPIHPVGHVRSSGPLTRLGLAQVLGRYFAREWAKRQLDASPVMRTLERSLQQDAFNMIVCANFIN